jgi:pyruvate dehydrogenase E2 component (dihydrolipoamide acetyltransferase)
MATAIIMPQVGQDLVTAVILKWHIHIGQGIKKGDIVALVESDKASFEVEAFSDGTVLHLLFEEGDVAEVLKPIAFIGKPGESLDLEKIMHEMEIDKALPFEKPVTKLNLSPDNGKFYISPSARRIARENHFNPENLSGTGSNGRIIKRDILTALQSSTKQSVRKVSPLARSIAEKEGIPLKTIEESKPDGKILKKDVLRMLKEFRATLIENQIEKPDTVVQFNQMRKIIAERLNLSKLTIPHFYLTREIDFTHILIWRQNAFEKSGLKISINDIIIKVVAEALRSFPRLNAHVDDEKIILKAAINIGIAVSVDEGLFVPVIPDADKKSLMEISVISRKNAEDARRGVVNSLVRGTFTISNLGMMGITHFQSIINPPESGILTIGSIEKKIVHAGKTIEVHDVALFGLACDHRAVDGAYGAAFLQFIYDHLNNFQ